MSGPDLRLDVLEGCYRVLGDAMDSMWAAWARFDPGQMGAGAANIFRSPFLASGKIIGEGHLKK